MARWDCWFETEARRDGLPLAVAGCDPIDAIEGRFPGDTGHVTRALADAAPDHPRGGLAGWVAFDGRFWLGLYPDLAPMPSESWVRKNAPFAWRPETTSLDESGYVRAVERVQEFIRAGDIYQVNLTRTLRGRFEGCARSAYTRLRAVSPGPFGAYLETPGLTVVSGSPELFLRMVQRQITTRPIKGTRPRSSDPGEDARAARELLRSPKEVAELIMITDLERNDLGQICEYGSVTVSDLVRRESYAHVHHLLSTVTGRMRAGVTHPEALARCFPGGSITGAPKKRACEIIEELEPEPRGLYTGALGYFGFNGESQFNIIIRTLAIDGAGVGHLGVGAGITIDSEPRAEFHETEHKAAGWRAVFGLQPDAAADASGREEMAA